MESPLAVKCSNLADWTMNWSTTGRIGYGAPPPLRPPHVHLMSLTYECSQFCHSSVSMYYCQRKPKSKNRVGLGTRLLLLCSAIWYEIPKYLHTAGTKWHELICYTLHLHVFFLIAKILRKLCTQSSHTSHAFALWGNSKQCDNKRILFELTLLIPLPSSPNSNR